MARNSKGQFVKGTSGNPNGRPRKEREQKYYEITTNSVTFADWKMIVEKAAKQAKAGDKYAREWLSKYLVGEPEQYINMDGQTRIIVEHVRDTDPTA